MTLLKVEDIKRPLLKGELFIVPCIIRVDLLNKDRLFVTPVINLPHNDKQNGQHETHYHADYRFLKHDGNGKVQNKHSKYYFCEQSRLNGTLEYFVMTVINENFYGATPVQLISKSKLKHQCIYKGKCPHRGYDLSQVKAIDGKIRCPLHGLEFDEKTGKVLNTKQNFQ